MGGMEGTVFGLSKSNICITDVMVITSKQMYIGIYDTYS